MTPGSGVGQPGETRPAGQPFAVGLATAARPASIDELVSQLIVSVHTQMGEPL